MEYKKVGRTGLKVSAIGIGSMTVGAQVSEADTIKIVDMAFERGINLFDTANAYAGGRSEEIIGKAIKNKRLAIVLATKVGHRQGTGPNDLGLSRKHIIRALEDSLRRLDTDYIDIYYAHIPDDSTPIEETLRAFDTLVKQGKVRYIACSNYSVWRLCKALSVSLQNGLARFDCIQSPYNLISRDIEYELLPCCASEGIGVTAYSPLAAGLLTGKYDPGKVPAFNTRFSLEKYGSGAKELYWSSINFQAVKHLKQIAEARGWSLAQFSLAWILNNPLISSAIVGISSTKQLEENFGAVDLKFTEEDTKACDEVWREIRPPGFRYGK
jgi:aryl-alcohol dehydrogenase-like predicted oxidoreductase